MLEKLEPKNQQAWSGSTEKKSDLKGLISCFSLRKFQNYFLMYQILPIKITFLN
jgi:hypothetical protein